jgi:hypothetical protein
MSSTAPVLPHGMYALDDVCVVRMANVVCITQNDDDQCVVVMSHGGTATIDCDIEELLRRIAVQNPGIPAQQGI